MFHSVRVIPALLLLAAAFLSGTCLTAGAGPWPTTQIDVYKGDSGFFMEDDEDDLPAEPEVRKLEAFLSYAAKQMQDMGFPAPALEVIETDTCKACYRIYLDETVIAGSGVKGQTSNNGWSFTTGTYAVVTINRERALSRDEKRILPGAYITGAHELFHAVQDRTTYLYDDDPVFEPNPAGNWISEGTAEAIALYLFETYPARAFIVSDDRYIEGISDEKRYGGRRYSEPLPVQEDDEANPLADYRTSSFWRYLAELAAIRDGADRAHMPGPGKEKADFSYLAEFLATKNPGQSARRELNWLDHTLFNTGPFYQPLGETYARFLTTTASYWNHRYADRAITQDAWLKMFFGNCISLPLKPGLNSSRKTVTLPEMSARCIRVDVVDGDGPVVFDLQVDTPVRKEAGQLWVGTNSGQIVARRVSEMWETTTERELGLWSGLVTDPANPAIFILTNAADPASQTKPVTVGLQATSGKRDKQGAAPSKAAEAKDPGPDGRSEAQKKRVEAASNDLSLTGQFAMQIDRSDSEMTIHLGTAPLALDAAFGVSGSGGIMDQIITAGGSLGSASDAVRGAYLTSNTQGKTGDDVYIRIPRIEYGFTGTIEGAKISTTAQDGTQLFAIGPTDSLPGPQREFRPSGIVTVLSFSPQMLIASYMADFVDPDSLTPSQMQQSQPTLGVAYSGCETFSISAPWARMDEAAGTMPADPWRDLESDLMKRMPPELADASRDIVAEARRASEEDREPDFSAIRSGPGSAGTCDCSCAGLDAINRMGEAVDAAGRAPTSAERQLAMCAMTCSTQYAICEAD